MTDDHQKFSDWFRAQLVERHLRYTDAARILGVSTQAVTSWAKGRGHPQYPQLVKIAQTFRSLPGELGRQDDSVSVTDTAAAQPLLATEVGAHWATWIQHYRRLVEYSERNSTADPRQDFIDPDNFRLGVWVAEQRRKYAEMTLDFERKVLLEQLPGWTWNVHERQFDQGFVYLIRYRGQFGDVRVPHDYRDPTDGFHLGNWIAEQRRKFWQGRLSPARIARLERLVADGWGWGLPIGSSNQGPSE